MPRGRAAVREVLGPGRELGCPSGVPPAPGRALAVTSDPCPGNLGCGLSPACITCVVPAPELCAAPWSHGGCRVCERSSPGRATWAAFTQILWVLVWECLAGQGDVCGCVCAAPAQPGGASHPPVCRAGGRHGTECHKIAAVNKRALSRFEGRGVPHFILP